LVFAFTAISVRLYFIQVYPNPRLTRLQSSQLSRVTELQPQRGDIYDTNLEELAVTRMVDSFHVTPALFRPDPVQTAALSRLTNLPARDLLALRKRTSHFAWLIRRVDETTSTKIKALGIPGLHLRKEPQRAYPNGSMAAHVLGFVNRDSKGVYGIERYLDDQLSGQPTTFTFQRDALGRSLYGEKALLQRQHYGRDVVLTLDKHLQYVAERELAAAMQEHEAHNGFILLMDITNGQLLAVAHYPTFDPNDYGHADPASWRARAFTDPFEPGSTFKVFTMAAALAREAISPEDLVYCEDGKIKIGKHHIHDTHKHRWLKYSEVIKYSSNIGALKIARKVGPATLHDWYAIFGFGQLTGVGYSGESAGSIKPVSQWDEYLAATSSFGQGISVTGIQLLGAFAAAVNGGFMVKPTLLRPTPEQPIVEKKRILPEHVSTALRTYLFEAVEPGGTGVRARVPGFRVGGKTGTAQKYDQQSRAYSGERYLASFLGFGPLEEPRLAALVVLDEPRKSYYGGTVAAPVFSRVMSEAFAYLGLHSTDTNRLILTDLAIPEPQLPPEALLGDLDRFPDLTGASLREVLRRFPGRDFSIKGSGFVIDQNPVPGTPIAQVSTIAITLADRSPDHERPDTI